MKKFLITLSIIGLLAVTANAEPWAHRYDGTGGQDFQATNVLRTSTLTVAVEWNQPTWNHLDFGWGTSTDGTGWNWQDCPWFEDGNGNDKRCRTDVTFNTNGTFYYAFRLDYSGGIFYQYGDSTWQDIAANTTLSGDPNSTITVIPEPALVSILLFGLGLLFIRK